MSNPARQHPHMGRIRTADVNRYITATTDAQHGLITRQQLQSFGLSGSAIKDRVTRGLLQPVRQGIYRLGPLSFAGRCRADLLAAPAGAFVSELACAACRGLWDSREVGSILVVTPTGFHESPGLRRRFSRVLQPHDVDEVDGLAVASPARMLLDCALVLTQGRLRSMMRELDFRRQFDAEAILDVIDRAGTWKAGRLLRVALARFSAGCGGTDSPLEDRWNSTWTRAGLVPPPGNVVFTLPSGRTARVDHVVRELDLLIEGDGTEAHATLEQLKLDIERQSELEAIGWTVERYTWDTAHDHARSVMSRLDAHRQRS